MKEERLSASVGPRLRRFGAEKDEVLVVPFHHIVTCQDNGHTGTILSVIYRLSLLVGR